MEVEDNDLPKILLSTNIQGHLQLILIWPWCKTLKQRNFYRLTCSLKVRQCFLCQGKNPKAYEQGCRVKFIQVLYKQGESLTGSFIHSENGEVFDPFK